MPMADRGARGRRLSLDEPETPPAWMHTDLKLSNLLVKNGVLVGVVDFDGLSVRDRPAARATWDLRPRPGTRTPMSWRSTEHSAASTSLGARDRPVGGSVRLDPLARLLPAWLRRLRLILAVPDPDPDPTLPRG